MWHRYDMRKTFAGFREFLEDAHGPTTRPDQKQDEPGKGSAMDSIDVQSMELGVDPKDLESIPFVGANIQLGRNKILGGLSSWTVLKIDKDTVTLELRDEGN